MAGDELHIGVGNLYLPVKSWNSPCVVASGGATRSDGAEASGSGAAAASDDKKVHAEVLESRLEQAKKIPWGPNSRR